MFSNTEFLRGPKNVGIVSIVFRKSEIVPCKTKFHLFAIKLMESLSLRLLLLFFSNVGGNIISSNGISMSVKSLRVLVEV